MKYRIFYAWTIALFIIIAVLISGPAISGGTADKRPQLAPSTTTFEGTLVVKEGHGDILVKSNEGHQRRLKVKQSSVITRNGKKAAFAGLQIRDQVRVTYDSKRVVVELEASGS